MDSLALGLLCQWRYECLSNVDGEAGRLRKNANKVRLESCKSRVDAERVEFNPNTSSVKTMFELTEKSCCCWSAQVMLTELIYFLYKTAEAMRDATTRPYLIKIACLSMFPSNGTVCEHIHRYPALEEQIQGEAGKYLIYYRVLVNLPSSFLALYYGAWSDKCGRKPFMMLPSIGSVLSILLYMISAVFEQKALLLVLAGALVQGCLGKASIISMGVNSYIADITEKNDRTKTLGHLLAMHCFGQSVGALLAGVFQDTVDLQTTFCVVPILHTTVVLITVFCIKERVPLERKPAEIEKVHIKENVAYLCGNIKESLAVLTVRRANRGRTILFAMFTLCMLVQTCKIGEIDVTLLFVSRSPLNWTKTRYDYLLSLDNAVMGTCLIVILPILSNVLKLHDVSIVLIGLSCKLVRLFWAAFCTKSWMMYTSIAIGSFAEMTMSAIYSVITKLAETNELGKIFALLGGSQNISKLAGAVVFVNLYRVTQMFFPGFAYIVEGTLYAVMTMIMIFMCKDIKNIGSDEYLELQVVQEQYGTAGKTDTDEPR